MSRNDVTYTGRAGADLSGDAGRVMQITGSADGLPTIERATSAALGLATQALIGILEADAPSADVGTHVNVAIMGAVVENALAGAAIPANAGELTTDATGRLIPAVAGDKYIAYYLGHRAAVAGERINVKVLYGLTDAGGGSI